MKEFIQGPIFPWVFGGGFITLFTLAMLWLSNESGKIHRELDGFWLEANATNDLNELCAINKRLIAFAKAKCWHRHFGSHAREVNIFICAKIEGMTLREDMRKGVNQSLNDAADLLKKMRTA